MRTAIWRADEALAGELAGRNAAPVSELAISTLFYAADSAEHSARVGSVPGLADKD